MAMLEPTLRRQLQKEIFSLSLAGAFACGTGEDCLGTRISHLAFSLNLYGARLSDHVSSE